MSVNPYAPPQSGLESIDSNHPHFFVVSPEKLVVLWVATMGFYLVYWSYKNWSLYKQATHAKISPAIRAIFYPVFVYSLTQRIDREIRKAELKFEWSPGFLAIAIIVVPLIEPALFLMFDLDLGTGFSIGIFVGTLYLWRYLQQAINVVEGDPFAQSNSKFTLLEWVWVVLGTCLWVFIFSIPFWPY